MGKGASIFNKGLSWVEKPVLHQRYFISLEACMSNGCERIKQMTFDYVQTINLLDLQLNLLLIRPDFKNETTLLTYRQLIDKLNPYSNLV